MWLSFAPHCMWILYMSFPNVLLYAKHLPTSGQFEDKVTSLDWPLSQSIEQFHNKVSEFCILDIFWTCDISSAKVSFSHSLSFYMQCTKTEGRRMTNEIGVFFCMQYSGLVKLGLAWKEGTCMFYLLTQFYIPLWQVHTQTHKNYTET